MAAACVCVAAIVAATLAASFLVFNLDFFSRSLVLFVLFIFSRGECGVGSDEVDDDPLSSFSFFLERSFEEAFFFFESSRGDFTVCFFALPPGERSSKVA